MVKILIAGDFCPINRIEKLIIDERFHEIYNDFLPYLSDNDMNIINMECPVIDKTSPYKKIGPNLIAHSKSIDALLTGKFNLVTLSNNHIMDQGEAGLFSTIEQCKRNNIEYIGAGTDLEDASFIHYKNINNQIFAFLNFSENEFSSAERDVAGSNPLNPVSNYYNILSARSNADYVIVIVHGGHEGYNLPSPRMIETYRFFIDIGADVVVSHHSHCYSGYESYKKGSIFYGLGNFIFDWPGIRNTDWNKGYCIRLLFNESKVEHEIIPYHQCNEKPGIYLLHENEKKEFDKSLFQLNHIISDEKLIMKAWDEFSEKRKTYYLAQFEGLYSNLYSSLRFKKLVPGLISNRKKRQLLNLLRCESHRDLAIESLKSSIGNK